MINGRSLAHLGPRDLDAVAEMVMNLLIEVAALNERVAALEADHPDDAGELRADVDAIVQRVLPRL